MANANPTPAAAQGNRATRRAQASNKAPAAAPTPAAAKGAAKGKGAAPAPTTASRTQRGQLAGGGLYVPNPAMAPTNPGSIRAYAQATMWVLLLAHPAGYTLAQLHAALGQNVLPAACPHAGNRPPVHGWAGHNMATWAANPAQQWLVPATPAAIAAATKAAQAATAAAWVGKRKPRTPAAAKAPKAAAPAPQPQAQPQAAQPQAAAPTPTPAS